MVIGVMFMRTAARNTITPLKGVSELRESPEPTPCCRVLVEDEAAARSAGQAGNRRGLWTDHVSNLKRVQLHLQIVGDCGSS